MITRQKMWSTLERETLEMQEVSDNWRKQRDEYTERECRRKRLELLGDVGRLIYFGERLLDIDRIYGPDNLRDQQAHDCIDRVKESLREALRNVDRLRLIEATEMDELGLSPL